MRKKVQPTQSTPQHICDDCKHGTWFDVQWNRSMIDGKPLTLHCPHRQYGILRGTKACDKYEQRL